MKWSRRESTQLRWILQTQSHTEDMLGPGINLILYRQHWREKKALNFLHRVLKDVTPLVRLQLSADDTVEPELQPDKGIDLLCAWRDTGLLTWAQCEHTQQPFAPNS